MTANMALAHSSESEQRALDFFWRADFTDLLNRIWDSIKRMPTKISLKVVAVVAFLAAAALAIQNISVAGLIAVGASVASLLFAAMSRFWSVLRYCAAKPDQVIDFLSRVEMAVRALPKLFEILNSIVCLFREDSGKSGEVTIRRPRILALGDGRQA